MYRVRRDFDRWKQRWPWSWIFRSQVNERFCRKCGLPFQDGPMPKHVQRFQKGNMCALVFPAGGFRKKEFVVRVGRWRASNGRFFCSEYLPTEDLFDALDVLQQAADELAKPPKRSAR